MKKLFYIFLLLFTINMNAQVGINTNNPDPSAMLEIYATDKGISIPNIYIQSITDNVTIPNPQRSLIIFNTNDNLVGGVGYYYWTGNKWDFLFSDLNGFLLDNLTKYYSKTNQSPLSFNNNTFSNTLSAKGDALSSGDWAVINDLTTAIDVDRSTNEILFTLTGMAQISNTSSTTGSVRSLIGMFIDDVLVDIKPVVLSKSETCSYRAFTVYGKASNIAAGSHTVKFAIRNLEQSGGNNNITWGGRNTSNTTCNNTNNNHLNDFEARMSSVVLINQPFNF